MISFKCPFLPKTILLLALVTEIVSCNNAPSDTTGKGKDKQKDSDDNAEGIAANSTFKGRWKFVAPQSCKKTRDNVKRCDFERVNLVPAVIEFYNQGRNAAILFYNMNTLDTLNKLNIPVLPSVAEIANQEYDAQAVHKPEDSSTWTQYSIDANNKLIHSVTPKLSYYHIKATGQSIKYYWTADTDANAIDLFPDSSVPVNPKLDQLAANPSNQPSGVTKTYNGKTYPLIAACVNYKKSGNNPTTEVDTCTEHFKNDSLNYFTSCGSATPVSECPSAGKAYACLSSLQALWFYFGDPAKAPASCGTVVRP